MTLDRHAMLEDARMSEGRIQMAWSECRFYRDEETSISAQETGVGKNFQGFMVWVGSNTSLTRRIASRSASL